MKKDTLLIHSGRDPARYQGMVNTPVSGILDGHLPDLTAYEARGGDDYKKVRYGLAGTPTTFAFEEAVAKMEERSTPRWRSPPGSPPSPPRCALS